MNDVYASGSRQITVDVLRGYFILSMASAHLSTGFFNNLLHVWVWVDGAAGFVCLSGFVLGLSQRARWQRGAGHAAQLWILRRAAQIWLVATGLTIAALATRLMSDEVVFIEDVFREGRLPSAIVEVLLLQLHVPYFGILSMYVVFLVFAYFAVTALKRDLGVIVLLASIAIYALSQLFAIVMPPELGEQRFAKAAWQLLFFMGLVAGWHWQDKLRPLARAAYSWIFAVSTLGVVVFLTLARSAKIPYVKTFNWDLSDYFLKFTLSPPTVLYFLFVLAFLACMVELVRRWKLVTPVLQAVALFGRHSLGCFVILSLMQVVLWIVTTPDTPHEARDITWFAIALIVFTVYGLAAEMKPDRQQTHAPRRPMRQAPQAEVGFTGLAGGEAQGSGGVKRR